MKCIYTPFKCTYYSLFVLFTDWCHTYIWYFCYRNAIYLTSIYSKFKIDFWNGKIYQYHCTIQGRGDKHTPPYFTTNLEIVSGSPLSITTFIISTRILYCILDSIRLCHVIPTFCITWFTNVISLMARSPCRDTNLFIVVAWQVRIILALTQCMQFRFCYIVPEVLSIHKCIWLYFLVP